MRKTSTYIRKRRANPARCANPHSVWHVLNRTEPLREGERVQLTAPVRVSFEKFKGKRPPNALLARGWIQVQAVVGAAGCQRWGSREEMSACLVVGRRVMTSRRYA